MVQKTKIIDPLFHALKIFAALCLAAMIVMVFGNVVLRYALNSGISVSEELSSWGTDLADLYGRTRRLAATTATWASTAF